MEDYNKIRQDTLELLKQKLLERKEELKEKFGNWLIRPSDHILL